MGALHYGNVSIARDGSTVSCLVDGVVVSTLTVELAENARSLSLPFGPDHTFWLCLEEMNVLFDVVEPVAEVVEAPAAEPVTEPVAEEAAAPATTSRRGRRKA